MRAPSAWIPIAMSLTALAVVVIHVATVGTAREADEGAAAHLWQLLMGGQLPVIAYYAMAHLPHEPRQGIGVLGAQAAAAFAALAPVYILQF